MDASNSKNDVNISEIITCNERDYRLEAYLDEETILLNSIDGDDCIIVPVSQLHNEKGIATNVTGFIKHEFDILTIRKELWQDALTRQEVIAPLAKMFTCDKDEITKAANILQLSSRQVYNLIKKYRESDYQIKSLIPILPTGGRGKQRLSVSSEKIVSDCICEMYLNKQKLKISKVYEEIIRRCHLNELKPPSYYTVRNRIQKIPKKVKLTKRNGAKVAREVTDSLHGKTPEARFTNDVWQIDHTLVDLIIVDELHRQPIGRPYVTFAIDVYSRCITGICLTLEAPSAVSVGLCLSHAVLDKNAWLTQMNIEGQWLTWGKPYKIYVDNGADFHSEALKRGCAYHDIKVEYRPIGKAHYGGIVERVIGTMMQLVHQLPGTTFSNIEEKGLYNSEKEAALTLTELAQWLTISIINYYHKKKHSSLQLPPLAQYQQGLVDSPFAHGKPPAIQNPKAFIVDFLPIVKRKLRREGIVLDYITYYSSALSPLIAERDKYGSIIVRRDPRDISKVYVLDPRGGGYIEVPYQDISKPTISLWEHKLAMRKLRNEGRQLVDEDCIFKAIEKMREIAKAAAIKSKKSRRALERQKILNKDLTLDNSETSNTVDDMIAEVDSNAKPFDDIDTWS